MPEIQCKRIINAFCRSGYGCLSGLEIGAIRVTEAFFHCRNNGHALAHKRQCRFTLGAAEIIALGVKIILFRAKLVIPCKRVCAVGSRYLLSNVNKRRVHMIIIGLIACIQSVFLFFRMVYDVIGHTVAVSIDLLFRERRHIRQIFFLIFAHGCFKRFLIKPRKARQARKLAVLHSFLQRHFKSRIFKRQLHVMGIILQIIKIIFILVIFGKLQLFCQIIKHTDDLDLVFNHHIKFLIKRSELLHYLCMLRFNNSRYLQNGFGDGENLTADTAPIAELAENGVFASCIFLNFEKRIGIKRNVLAERFVGILAGIGAWACRFITPCVYKSAGRDRDRAVHRKLIGFLPVCRHGDDECCDTVCIYCYRFRFCIFEGIGEAEIFCAELFVKRTVEAVKLQRQLQIVSVLFNIIKHRIES